MCPLHWVWILYTLLFFNPLMRLVGISYVAGILPIGFFFDWYQMQCRFWLRKWRRILGPMDVYPKFQTFKSGWHEEKYLCFAHTKMEVAKLHREPIFVKGRD